MAIDPIGHSVVAAVFFLATFFALFTAFPPVVVAPPLAAAAFLDDDGAELGNGGTMSEPSAFVEAAAVWLAGGFVTGAVGAGTGSGTLDPRSGVTAAAVLGAVSDTRAPLQATQASEIAIEAVTVRTNVSIISRPPESAVESGPRALRAPGHRGSQEPRTASSRLRLHREEMCAIGTVHLKVPCGTDVLSSTMRHVSFDEIQALLELSGAETLVTLAENGALAPTATWATTDDAWIVAVVPFVADGQEGRVTLLGPRRAARRLQPAPETWHDGLAEVTECDVIGELANLLLGRFKHLLLAEGAEIRIGTPETRMTRELPQAAKPGAPGTCELSLGQGDRLLLHLATSTDGEDRPIPSQRRPLDTVAEVLEGELVLF